MVTTVRSPAKGNNVLTSHADISNGKLSYLVVSDITNPKAFEHVSMQCTSFWWAAIGLAWLTTRKYAQVFRRGIPFSAVFHTASPFHDNFVDPVDGLLKPAINGTKNILHAIKAYAPTCKRVVITSSFAAIVNPNRPPKIYDESSWNPVSWDEAVTDRTKAYRGSKVSIVLILLVCHSVEISLPIFWSLSLTMGMNYRRLRKGPDGSLYRQKSQVLTWSPSTRH